MTIRPAIWTTRLTTPGAGAFALLFGLEALSRALITVALPLQTAALVGSDEGVSQLFLMGSVSAIAAAFVIPTLAEVLGRARLCTLAMVLIALSALLFTLGALPSEMAGFIARACGIAILHAGLSMFVMDHIRRQEFGRSEPLRLLSIGIAWTVGPTLGVAIEGAFGPWAPFLASAAAVLLALAYFWALRMRKLAIVRPARRRPLTNPFVRLATFLAQPRLVLAWLHAIGRGMFWASFIIYTPLYADGTGLGAATGGFLVSLGSVFMLLMPLWGWLARRFGIRRLSLTAFPLAAIFWLAAGLLAAWPWIGAVCIVFGAIAMTAIDGYGNALFFRACRPSQRSTMTAIFATQRDMADLAHAALFAVLLSYFPIQVVFLAIGLILVGLTLLSTRINRRL
jgi:MFS family permease